MLLRLVPTRGVFSPPGGGEIEIRAVISPPHGGGWGGNQLFFPLHIADPGGEIEEISPSPGGEKPAAGGKF